MSNELLWYTGRGSGVIALILLTLVVVLGILGRSGRSAAGLTRFAVADVHNNASLMALGLVLLHEIVLWADPYARLRIFDLIIPFDAAYRPFWVGLGTIGAELMVLVVVTSLIRHRIGARVWKAIHWSAYGLWPIAWLHSWFSGSDADTVWFRLIAIACLMAAIAAVAWRLSPKFLEIPRPRPNPMAAVPPPTSASRHSADTRPAQPNWGGDATWYREPSWHGQPPASYQPGWQASTGSQPTWSGQTGSQPGWQGHSGSQPAWQDHTGSQPTSPDHTGSQPVWPDQQAGPPPGWPAQRPRQGDAW